MKPASSIIAILASLLLALPSFSQTTQSGIVQEYNEKAKKTPLDGVELNVRNANNAVSAKDGSFSLQFQTLKPGDKVNVRRIEKLGYEIFNKEALEQWNLNPKTPFVIILCRSDKFKKIRDNYEKVSSESYARQLQKEEAALAKLKAEGKLKEEEYSRQLSELRDSYEDQLDKLESYIDRFSRIDLSELSSTEQEIIALVQEGRIDEAIQKYEEQNYVEQYTVTIGEKKEVETAINQLQDVRTDKEQTLLSLGEAIKRQIETLRLAGGKENFGKIETIFRQMYEADTLNTQNLMKYASFLFLKRDYLQAYPLHQRLRSLCQDPDDLWECLNQMSLMDKRSGRFSSALEVSDTMISIYQNDKNSKSADEVIGLYQNRGLIYYAMKDFDNALKCYEHALEMDEAKQCTWTQIASVRNGIANVLSALNHKRQALDQYKEIFELYKTHDDGTHKAKERIAGTSMNIAQSCRTLSLYTDAEKYITEAENCAEFCYKYDPDRYYQIYTMVLNSSGNILSDMNLLKKAEQKYLKAMEIMTAKYSVDPDLHWYDLSQISMNLAIFYNNSDEFEKALEMYDHTLEIANRSQSSLRKHEMIRHTLFNLSYMQIMNGELEKARMSLAESLQHSRILMANNKMNEMHNFLGCLNNYAYCLQETNQISDAHSAYQEGLDLIDEIGIADNPSLKSRKAEICFSFAELLIKKENSPINSIPLFSDAFHLYEDMGYNDDSFDCCLGLAYSYLKCGSLADAKSYIEKSGNYAKQKSDPGWHNIKGLIALKENDMDTAKLCRDKIIELTNDSDKSEFELLSHFPD